MNAPVPADIATAPRRTPILRSAPARVLGITRATLVAGATDRVSLAAGGCAFFSTLALFPAMSLLIAVYGLVFNPRSIEPHLEYLSELLPPDAFTLLARWMHHLVLQSSRRLGLGVGVSGVITVWSAAIGTRALLATLGSAYETDRRGGFLALNVMALCLTAGAMALVILGITVLTVLPIVLAVLDLTDYGARLVRLAGNALMIVSAAAFIALLYRFGSRGSTLARRRFAPGAVLATVLWLLASALLSAYVGDVARFGMTYGPLGAVIGLMLWLYFTFYAVLIGAEFNAQLEHQG